jgi:hypothetical protein
MALQYLIFNKFKLKFIKIKYFLYVANILSDMKRIEKRA